MKVKNCKVCGAPLDDSHNYLTCNTNRMTYELGMGMTDPIIERNKVKQPEPKKPNWVNLALILLVILIVLVIIIKFL